MDDDTAALIDILRTSHRPALRLEAVRQIAAANAVEAVPALLAVLDDAADPRSLSVVTAALTTIQQMGPAAAPHIEEGLRRNFGNHRQFMPLLLASSLAGQSFPLLSGMLCDPDLEVAVNAATQLGQLRLAAAFDPLVAVVRDDSAAAALRGAAAAALGALRDPRALPVLIELLDAPEREILAGAIDGLSDLRDPAGAPHLERLLERRDLDQSTERAVRLGLLAMERYRPSEQV